MVGSPALIRVRPAIQDDLVAINEIYNEAVLHSTATFDTDPKSLEDRRRWFEKHGDRHPVLVSEAGGQVTGWASLSEWSDRRAYADTAEASIYLAEAARGRGTGKQLYRELVHEARRLGFHTLIARIADANEASIRLHEGLGFEKIGVMREVGRKFGKLLDVHLYQLLLLK